MKKTLFLCAAVGSLICLSAATPAEASHRRGFGFSLNLGSPGGYYYGGRPYYGYGGYGGYGYGGGYYAPRSYYRPVIAPPVYAPSYYRSYPSYYGYGGYGCGY
ncbi:MAG: hypothetical protein R3C11_28160 [Planctomycetaceae bacterium]